MKTLTISARESFATKMVYFYSVYANIFEQNSKQKPIRLVIFFFINIKETNENNKTTIMNHVLFNSISNYLLLNCSVVV
jgi:hypothetical protein